jgi:hypothetical protein
MLTKDEAHNIISQLNEDAHAMAYDSWSEADEVGDSDDEEDWGRAEELREDASYEQAGYFRSEFNALPQEEQDAIWHYAQTDEDFEEDFKTWYGQEEYDEYISGLEE